MMDEIFAASTVRQQCAIDAMRSEASLDDEEFKTFCFGQFEKVGRECIAVFAAAPEPTFPADAPIAHKHAIAWLKEQVCEGSQVRVSKCGWPRGMQKVKQCPLLRYMAIPHST